ncbi:hypothetical protein CR513_17370, partial [Mucuna pruriens]
MVVTYRDWHEMLPFALHGYHTSVCTPTGVTPYSLVNGMKAVLPIELSLIKEKRLATLCHDQLYQQRVKKVFDKKIHPREFQEGDLVLKKILPIQKDHRGKWTPNYKGPYMVKRAFSEGAMILTNMDGQDLPYLVNSDTVKKFYP